MHHAQLRKHSQGAIEPTLQIDETSVAFTKRARKEFEYFVGGWSAVMTFEPDSWLSSMYRTGASQNYLSFSDTQLDSMIDRQVRIFNNQERKTAVVDIVKYALDKVPSVPPAPRYFLNGISPKVRDFAPYFRLSARQYEWVWLDA
jgi:ABC-type transport system substrate-binding protein